MSDTTEEKSTSEIKVKKKQRSKRKAKGRKHELWISKKQKREVRYLITKLSQCSGICLGKENVEAI